MGMIMHHFSTNLENEVFIHQDLVKTRKQGWIVSETLAGTLLLTFWSEKNIKDEYIKYQREYQSSKLQKLYSFYALYFSPGAK